MRDGGRLRFFAMADRATTMSVYESGISQETD